MLSSQTHTVIMSPAELQEHITSPLFFGPVFITAVY